MIETDTKQLDETGVVNYNVVRYVSQSSFCRTIVDFPYFKVIVHSKCQNKFKIPETTFEVAKLLCLVFL